MDESVSGDGLLWAIRFSGGRAEPFADRRADWSWRHFALADIRARNHLARLEILPDDAREGLLTDETRLQIRRAGGWTYGVLPDMERDLAGEVEGPGRLHFAFDDDHLITARRHPLKIIEDVRRAAHQGEAMETPADGVEQLIEHFIEVAEERLEALGDQIDAIEDRVLGGSAGASATALGPIRRELAWIRREFAGLRGAFSRAGPGRQGRKSSAVSLSERFADLTSLIEDVDREAANLQERGRLLHEELDTLINSATNRNMRALTVISTLLIPPTLITGAFGMNVKGIPFGDSPLGFTLAGVVCLGVVVAALQLLRKLELL